MMNSRLFRSAAAVLFVTVTAGFAAGQVVALEDFEGPLPGPQQYPGGYSYWGDGDETTDLAVTEQVTDQDAASGIQSYQIDLDSSAITTWWYYGLGGFLGFWGNDFGAAAGQPGEDNPANFVMSFDIKIEGVIPGGEKGVGGSLTLFKGDYEAVNSVDLNNDGDMEDGYNLWTTSFTTTLSQEPGWAHVEWNLASGTAPTVPQTDGVDYFDQPVFDDEAAFAFQIYPFNSPGGFGNDADNVVNIDNVQLEFFPSSVTAGDFDEDGDIDGQDFLIWQRDTGVGSLSDWQTNYGTGGLPANIMAVPEPTAYALVLSLLASLGLGRRR